MFFMITPHYSDFVMTAVFAVSLRQLIRGMFRKESQRRARNAWLLSWISICACAVALIVAESGSTLQ
jgi:hypothetical protein